MGACTECRKAKVKCDHLIGTICARCQRLGKQCIPHQSRQGQKPSHNNNNNSNNNSNNSNSSKRHKNARTSASSSLHSQDEEDGIQALQSLSTTAVELLSRQSSGSAMGGVTTNNPMNHLSTNSRSNHPQPPLQQQLQRHISLTHAIARVAGPAAVMARHQQQQPERKKQKTNTNNSNNRTKQQQQQQQQQKSEDAAISSQMMEQSTISKHHYGLNYLVRSWVALAFARRSFSLLARAGKLAVQCGMHMDDILCELQGRPNASDSDHQRGMDFLYPILLTPVQDQKVVGPPLTLGDIPRQLLKSCGLLLKQNHHHNHHHNNNNHTNGDPAVALERWFSIRRIYKGISRFYCSPGWEQHIVSRQIMEDTYQQNQQEISDLFLVDTGPVAKQNFAKLFTHQISIHTHPHATPRPTRQAGVQIRTVHGIVTVDQIYCFAIPTVDDSFTVTEFVPKHLRRRQSDNSLLRHSHSSTSLQDFTTGGDSQQPPPPHSQPQAAVSHPMLSPPPQDDPVINDQEELLDDLFVDLETIGFGGIGGGSGEGTGDEELKKLWDLLGGD